ncbi:MAG TPA: hypothetical protein VFI41_04745 [Gemmatimonadales bacterium]|nr:hypothetical protein [Gemmatimonadales bacterium]
MATEKKPAAKKAAAQPAKEYLHVVMAMHPLHQKPVPVATYEDEAAAWQAAATGNSNPKTQHLGYHVKKVAKGG